MPTMESIEKKCLDKSAFKKINLSLYNILKSIVVNIFFFQFKIKTSNGHILIKYVVLFSIILVAVVLSVVLAGYFSTKSLVEGIPNQVKKDLQKMPEWEILKKLPSYLSEIKYALQHGKNILIIK